MVDNQMSCDARSLPHVTVLRQSRVAINAIILNVAGKFSHRGSGRPSRWAKGPVAAWACYLWLLAASLGQGTQPAVAIRDSELTRALEPLPATNATPRGAGTTSNEWWTTDWHSFVMPESVKESLCSDGTAFPVVGGSNIMAGLVLTNGALLVPKYPIVISLLPRQFGMMRLLR